MKGRNYCCITILILSGCVNQQEKLSKTEIISGPGRKQENVRGPVHTMQLCWLETNGKGAPDTSLNFSYVFGKDGYTTEFYSFSKPGVVSSKGTYDAGTGIFTERSYTPQGQVRSSVEYSYDDKGNRISMKSYNGSPTPSYIEKYLYDDRDNRIQTEFYKGGRNATERRVDKYNSASQMIESRQFDAGGEQPEYTTYKYDEKGNRMEKDDFTGGKLHHINKYRYDKNNNIVEETSEYVDRDFRSIHHLSYEYDARGNWTKQMGNRTDNPGFVIVRVFTYY